MQQSATEPAGGGDHLHARTNCERPGRSWIGERDLDIGRRNIEGGGRASTYDHANYRAVAGVTGSPGEAWTYDAYLLYYYTNLFQSNLGYLNLAAVDSALQVRTNAAGQPVCIVGGNCVPYDIFAAGAVTSQQLSYLYTPGTIRETPASRSRTQTLRASSNDMG